MYRQEASLFDVSKKRLYSSAFTIVELLVVIVVIGILAAITIVSYTGIAKKAGVASMQFELDNAYKKFNLYYTENVKYPTDINAAKAAKLVPLAAKDNETYTVDNNVSPSYYCYMYRDGTETYAIDSLSGPSRGACLKNLITNGDFSNGTTGWSSGPTLSVLNNEAYITPTSQYDGPAQYISTWANCKSHRLYYASSAKVDSTNVYMVLNDGIGQGIISPSSTGSYVRLSGVWTVNANALHVYTKLQDGRSAGWTTNYIKYWTVIDLTAAFGAGNEPTKAQMDTIMSSYPNNWFNNTTKANL